MARTEFLLATDLLPFLAHLAGTGSGTLSPWRRWEAATEVDEAAWEKLKAAQLCEEKGRLKRKVAVTIEKLKRPSRMVRLRLMTGPSMMEHLIYFCGPQAEAVSFTSNGDNLLVRDPAPLEQIIHGFYEYWGYSSLVSSGLNVRLEPKAALVFAAMVDLHRRQSLTDRVAMRPAVHQYYSPAQVLDAIEATPRDGQWLVATIKAFTGLEGFPTEDLVKENLDKLIKLQVAVQKDKGYGLEGDGMSFANNFLLSAQVLRLEVCTHDQEGKIARSAMLCLQAGLHDNLYLDREGEMVLLETVSSKHVVDMIETFLAEGSGC
ncbi:MAG: hypothetical protein KGZ63_08725 [Clostridiales bacterium]|nr:hypothetical protein [Clostridiales bacterium]